MVYPNDNLIILFDIDGTILDMRFFILFVLREFDRKHGTDYFKNLTVSDIDFHESQLKLLLNRLSIKEQDQIRILSYYESSFFSKLTIKRANRPYKGVFEIMKWFQTEPNTSVGLNTGRPEYLRFKTLSALNFLGKQFGIRFKSELLFMNDAGPDAFIPHVKKKGIEYFRRMGYRVFAFVDNEPENLRAIAEMDEVGEILLLHADTLSKSCKSLLTGNCVSGKEYEVEKLRSAI
ncbi:MAG: HAD family hydrolase [Deltaproteobacteria bacterium]|nr:HAD family hydrolase [Deltaproteobacteria bacterium]